MFFSSYKRKSKCLFPNGGKSVSLYETTSYEVVVPTLDHYDKEMESPYNLSHLGF